ncbi:MAG: GGDEF domain-containing protein, partial [Steroidobacteraceae bacterium]
SVICDLVDVEQLHLQLRKAEPRNPDVVLLDATWPAAQLLKTASRLRAMLPKVPLLLLPDLPGDDAGSQAGKSFAGRGAPAKESVGAAIVTAVRDALRRQRVQDRLLYLALRDELTGLYNRRAFRTLASQSLRLAHRQQRPLLLFFADVDGLKRINDRFGHGEGDRALGRAAAAFKATFAGKSDIAARLGGDEFVALVVEDECRGEQVLCRKLHAGIAARAAREHRYPLSLSVGVARFDPIAAPSLSQLMGQADEALYIRKRALAANRAPTAAHATPLPAQPFAVSAPTLS